MDFAREGGRGQEGQRTSAFGPLVSQLWVQGQVKGNKGKNLLL